MQIICIHVNFVVSLQRICAHCVIERDADARNKDTKDITLII